VPPGLDAGHRDVGRGEQPDDHCCAVAEASRSMTLGCNGQVTLTNAGMSPGWTSSTVIVSWGDWVIWLEATSMMGEDGDTADSLPSRSATDANRGRPFGWSTRLYGLVSVPPTLHVDCTAPRDGASESASD
jgi:hypothetical protein